MKGNAKRMLYAVYAALFIFMGFGATKVSISPDASDAMLEKDGESYQEYLEYLDNFPSDVGAVVVLVDLLCSEPGWELIKDIERSYRSSSVIRNTISIASPNARWISGTSTTIDLSRFTQLDLASSERCEKAYEYEPFKDLLVSTSGEAVAIYLVAEDSVDTKSFAETVEQIRDQYATKVDALGGKLLITGDPIMSTEIANVISRDIIFVFGLVILLLAMSFILTRSLKVVLATLLTTSLSMIGAFGFMGWLGLDITPGTALAIFLLGPLSAAFVIHAHGYAIRNTSSSIVPSEAAIPTLFAGLTTAILFGCTGLTPAPDVRSLAVLGTVGIVFATLGIFTATYPLLHSSKSLGYRIRFSFPRWVVLRPWISFGLLALILVEIVIGFTKIRFEYEAVDYLPLSNPKRAEFEEIGNWFGRMSIPLLIHTEPDTTNDPNVWQALSSLEAKIKQNSEKTHSASFYKQISTVTKVFTIEEDTDPLEFPEDPTLLKQLFLLFDREDYEFYVNDEENMLVATFHVPFIGSAEYFEFKNLVTKHFEGTDWEAALVGRVRGFFESGHRIGIDNLKGLAIGGAIVFIMLLALFKSITLSLIGLVVNCIPVFASLAALGLAGVPIDLGSSIVTAIAFGIVVDDSTHLIIRIKRLQSQGYDPSTAVVRAINDLIAPITATTIMTCIGFSVLFAAEMQPFHDFATTILIALLSALIADIVILPVLVRTFVRDFVRV